ncbi:MAG: hypothetical protein EOP04_05385 [Proteobacteria bacterium]|nr:MAG: hypothetical protein EOP04_05385 [Pseudomonadota bacterium]
MKNVLKILAFASSISALNACGTKDETKEESKVASFLSSGLDFNLGSYLSTSRNIKMPTMMSASSTGITVGKKDLFQLASNMTMNTKSQKINAQYYTDVTVFSNQVTPGHGIEVVASADTNRPAASVVFRVSGQELFKNNITSQMSLPVYRGSIGGSPNIPILAGLNVNLGVSVGGDIGVDIGPKYDDATQRGELEIKPRMNLYGKANTGVSALIANASVLGDLVLLSGNIPVSGGVQVVGGKSTPVLLVQPLDLKAGSGSVGIEATLSVGNALPGAARSAWKSVFGNGRTYKYDLVKWDGYSNLVTREYRIGPVAE